jgi:hypothetical protein
MHPWLRGARDLDWYSFSINKENGLGIYLPDCVKELEGGKIYNEGALADHVTSDQRKICPSSLNQAWDPLQHLENATRRCRYKSSETTQ